MSWIDTQYPSAIGKYTVTSPADGNYNCIGWAATGEKTEWWQHGPGYKWPSTNRSPLVESLVAVFTAIGFEKCESASAESGFHKVAIYARNGFWKHAARQLPSGRWTSKLGPDEDIEHDTVECLCGDSYGEVHCFMRRPV